MLPVRFSLLIRTKLFDVLLWCTRASAKKEKSTRETNPKNECASERHTVRKTNCNFCVVMHALVRCARKQICALFRSLACHPLASVFISFFSEFNLFIIKIKSDRSMRLHFILCIERTRQSYLRAAHTRRTYEITVNPKPSIGRPVDGSSNSTR